MWFLKFIWNKIGKRKGFSPKNIYFEGKNINTRFVNNAHTWVIAVLDLVELKNSYMQGFIIRQYCFKTRLDTNKNSKELDK